MKVFLIEKVDPIISILWSILIYSTCQTKINWESWFMIFKCAWRLLDNSFPNTVIVWHESQSCLTLCDRGILQVKHSSGQPFPSPGDLPKPGIEPRSPTLRADSLPAEPQGRHKSTGVSSLSLLQGIFPTQDQKQVSHIAGRFYTSWATRKALLLCIQMYLYNKRIRNKTINSIKANE